MPFMELRPPTPAPEAHDAVAPAIARLLTDGRNADGVKGVLEGLGPALCRAGLPLLKIILGIRQLHPELFTCQYRWDRRTGQSVESPRPHGVERSELFRQSPLPPIFAGAPMVRYVETGPTDPGVLYAEGRSIKDEGGTDVVSFTLAFSDGKRHAITYVGAAVEGLSDRDIGCLVAALPAVTCVLELKFLNEMAASLLDIYVGRDAGARILRGEIRRGTGETINAVIWFCDLACFTPLTASVPRDVLITMLNAYFDAMAAPVEREGGTIVKFIGDGMLAIFPLSPTGKRTHRLCRSALKAARDAAANIDALNVLRGARGEQPLSFGIALHVGDVMYGNIGAARRLDFTVIGPAVNMAARLEALSRSLGQSIIVSADFREAAGLEFHSHGRHALRGVSEPQEVFALT